MSIRLTVEAINFSMELMPVNQKGPACRQAGIASLVLILLVVAGIATTTYLVQNRTNFLPRADDGDNGEPPSDDGSSGPTDEGNTETSSTSETTETSGNDNPEGEGGQQGAQVATESDADYGTKSDAEAKVDSTWTDYQNEVSEHASELEGLAADLKNAQDIDDYQGAAEIQDKIDAINDQIDGARENYEGAAGVLEEVFGGDASKGQDVANAIEAITTGATTLDEAMAANPSFAPDQNAALMGFSFSENVPGATEAGLAYVTSHNFDVSTAAGFMSINVQSAGGTIEEMTAAAAAGARAAGGTDVEIAEAAAATAGYAGLEGDARAAAAAAAVGPEVSDKDFAAGVTGHGVSAPQATAAWNAAHPENPTTTANTAQIMSETRSAIAGEINTQGTAPTQPVGSGPNPVAEPASGPQTGPINIDTGLEGRPTTAEHPDRDGVARPDGKGNMAAGESFTAIDASTGKAWGNVEVDVTIAPPGFEQNNEVTFTINSWTGGPIEVSGVTPSQIMTGDNIDWGKVASITDQHRGDNGTRSTSQTGGGGMQVIQDTGNASMQTR